MRRKRKAVSNVGLALRSGRHRGCAQIAGSSLETTLEGPEELEIFAICHFEDRLSLLKFQTCGTRCVQPPVHPYDGIDVSERIKYRN